ncbi:PSD1 and planctomycete cytochrome C domain-containing protein [Arenibacter sp. F20364]|uniref:PSD1 and planctomycete cytochrome C domain-containing protein n=1 Tax=Arenibacter sp. F20364 TaxID=2926415 RepID=UPI001FF24B3E|nr:PSD1 and planctomycete cytochrome C domain-containing protein [Arenibacter sp. F20364]MCK0191867.1 PSD1 and planctomycete cytochrome C domain-containing protein [Arenibacter sp. F20364]
MVRSIKFFLYVFGIFLAWACGGPSLPEDVAMAYSELPEKIDFNLHVKPILSDKCFICHGPDKAKVKADLQLHLPELAYSELKESPGKFAIKPGNLKKSETFYRIISEDPNYVMPEPDSHLTLTDYEKALLIKWIEDGAEYRDHWAFLPPKGQGIPKIKHSDLAVNAIDNFVIRKIEDQNIKPSERADKETLLRRVSFDLIGLPPTLEEINAFVHDSDSNAFEKQVDRLLASEHYGEQRTLDWMDLARYADTHGYSVDRFRDVSIWRDWVIKSFNENMPYDQFLTWQLAGDMLPNATKEQILATTFNRLHPQNLEGGIIDEEFRSEYVSDRANVVGEGLLGLTVACAKCHDHKYDPISQKNYYEMYSFFNNVNETGLIPWDMATPVPTLMLPTEEQEQLLTYLETLVDEKGKEIKSIIRTESQKAKDWILNEGYKDISISSKPSGLVADLDFNQKKLFNKVSYIGQQNIRMRQQFADNQKTIFQEGFNGYGLSMDGDTWLDLDKLGIFKRSDAFSVGIQVYVPKELEKGVIFHKMQGPELHSYRGYHVMIKDNKLEVLLAHVWPENAIAKHSLKDIPRNEWVQLTMTYDGSSKAEGLHLYLNGNKLDMEVVVDNLYKDIIFNNLTDVIYDGPIEPGLRVGAIWRGKGIGGGKIDDLLVFDRELSEVEVLQIADPETLKSIIAKSKSGLSKEERQSLESYYLATNSIKYKESLKALEKAREVYVDSTEVIDEIMVMKEMAKPRQAYILERGQYDVYGEAVFPNTPESIFPYPDSLPKNRLGLAKWLTDDRNPLTARVAVNRYWQHIFGKGIVRTSEDFGNQGELPSHPELLDWLALEFIKSGWDVKALHKLMVMSYTYQQSSKPTTELMEFDKANRLLARGPSKRLTGEMLRNNALMGSGLLNRKIGGKSVKPYQPEGLWKVNGAAYEEDKGEKLYRRSMYTIWKRSVPHPTLATFDAPERSFCTVRRQETNTPLQALVLLNDPTYIEAARVMGKNMLGEENISLAIAKTFRKLTGRTIKDKELSILVEMQQQEYMALQENRSKVKGWLNTGEFRIASTDDAALVAANAIIASTIMNSDATITKR